MNVYGGELAGGKVGSREKAGGSRIESGKDGKNAEVMNREFWVFCDFLVIYFISCWSAAPSCCRKASSEALFNYFVFFVAKLIAA